MNFEEYNQLGEETQITMLLMQGVNLHLVRSCNEMVIQLYALDNFYVELFFRKTSSLCFQIKAFDQMKQLDVYLNSIDVSNLYAAR